MFHWYFAKSVIWKKGKEKRIPQGREGQKEGLFGFWPKTPYKCLYIGLAFSVECEEKESGMILDGDNVNSLSIGKNHNNKRPETPKKKGSIHFCVMYLKKWAWMENQYSPRYHARWMMGGWETLFHQYSCSIVNHGGTPVLSSADRLSSSTFSLKIWVQIRLSLMSILNCFWMSIGLSIFFWHVLVMEKGRFSNTQLIIVDYKVFVKLNF